MWLVFAILSAVFAALTSILARIGIEGVNSNLATAIRTLIVVVMSWAMVFITHSDLNVPKRSWLFLILSGLATGTSWLCYYRALQTGEVSKVASVDKFSIVITVLLASVFLGEDLTFRKIAGCALITLGTLLMIT